MGIKKDLSGIFERSVPGEHSIEAAVCPHPWQVPQGVPGQLRGRRHPQQPQQPHPQHPQQLQQLHVPPAQAEEPGAHGRLWGGEGVLHERRPEGQQGWGFSAQTSTCFQTDSISVVLFFYFQNYIYCQDVKDVSCMAKA